MNSRLALLVTCVVAILAVAGCTPSSIPAEDVASVCVATGAAMEAVDQAMLATADGRQEWASAAAAVGEVVDAARKSGYPAAVELAEDWQTSVIASSAADDPQTAFSLLIESEGNFGLLYMCDVASAPVPGVASAVDGDLEPDVPGWAGPAAWIGLGVAAVATAAVRRRRPGSDLVRGALQGLLAGSLLVLVAIVVVGGWMLADLDMFGLSLSPMDGIVAVLVDSATPVWALLLGGTTGAIIGSVLRLLVCFLNPSTYRRGVAK